MYSDPRHIRSNVVPVRINDDNKSRLEQVAMRYRTQPATFARDLIEAVLECDHKCEQVMSLLNL
jgi:predicted transcriptional regulator